MRGRLLTPIALLLAAPAAAAAPLSEPVTGEWLVGAFKSWCAEPFGDRAKLVAAIEAPDAGLDAIVEERPMPGTTGWESAKARISYSDGDFLPKSLPSPQCTLSARAAAGYDHLATAAALAAALELPPGKTKGKNGRFQTQWNFKGPKGEKRRLFLSQEPAIFEVERGFMLRVSLLNLR